MPIQYRPLCFLARHYKTSHIAVMNPDRDQLIIDRRKQGNTLAIIGREFNVSRERVRQIIRHGALKQKQNSASQKLLNQIRQADDLNRPFNRDALLNTIEYPSRVRGLMDWYFYFHEEEVSLKQLMDWCLPEITDDSSSLYKWVPAYKKQGFGPNAVRDLIHYIDKIDFGKAFGKEWKKRRDAFRKTFKESGKRALV